MYNTITQRKIAIYRTHLQVLENMHTHSQQQLWIYSTRIEKEGNLSELGLVLLPHPMLLTCSMNSSGKGWKDWMKRRGNELSSREGEGGQNSVLET